MLSILLHPPTYVWFLKTEKKQITNVVGFWKSQTVAHYKHNIHIPVKPNDFFTTFLLNSLLFHRGLTVLVVDLFYGEGKNHYWNFPWLLFFINTFFVFPQFTKNLNYDDALLIDLSKSGHHRILNRYSHSSPRFKPMPSSYICPVQHLVEQQQTQCVFLFPFFTLNSWPKWSQTFFPDLSWWGRISLNFTELI